MATIFRVTQNNIATNTLDNLQNSLQKIQDLQNQESSGKKINKPSDDPTGTANAMSYRAQQARLTQYSANADDANSWLNTAENTITSVQTSLTRASSLTIQGANGTSTATSRQALADEIGTLRDGIIGQANTTYNGHAVFSGTVEPSLLTPPTSAYNADGTYNGNSGAVNRTVGSGSTVQVNIPGPNLFGTTDTTTGANSVFDILTNIQNHLTSSNPADQNKLNNSYVDANGNTVPSDIDQLAAANKNVQNQNSIAGARFNRVTAAQTQASNQIDSVKTQLSNTENIDLPATIVALQLQNTAYQAALSATAKVIQPSLVSFLS